MIKMTFYILMLIHGPPRDAMLGFDRANSYGPYPFSLCTVCLTSKISKLWNRLENIVTPKSIRSKRIKATAFEKKVLEGRGENAIK